MTRNRARSAAKQACPRATTSNRSVARTTIRTPPAVCHCAAAAAGVPHTTPLRTQHTHGRSEATVERTGLGGRKAGAPARDRVELDVLVQAARVVARRAQEAPVHLRWEALRGQNAAAPGPYRRPAEHRSASSGELSQARMGHAARNGTATYAGPPCTTRGGVACTYLVASARTRSRKARTGTSTGRTRIGWSGARRRAPDTGEIALAGEYSVGRARDYRDVR